MACREVEMGKVKIKNFLFFLLILNQILNHISQKESQVYLQKKKKKSFHDIIYIYTYICFFFFIYLCFLKIYSMYNSCFDSTILFMFLVFIFLKSFSLYFVMVFSLFHIFHILPLFSTFLYSFPCVSLLCFLFNFF